MSEDEILVSEPNDSILINITISIIGFALFLFFFSIAIVDVDWAWLLGGLIPLIGILLNIANFYKKIYYFEKNKIVVADHKNEFIDQLNLDEIQCWNEYTERQKDGLRSTIVINSDYKNILIEKNDYKNYDDIVGYLNAKNLIQNVSLRPSSTLNKVTSSLEQNLFTWAFCVVPIVFFIFWSIVSAKKETSKVKYFSGEISKIDYSKKHHHVEIELNNLPSLHFRFNSDRSIEKFMVYNYDYGRNTYANLGKKIVIVVSNDDFNWKIENKLIHKIDVNPIPYLDVQSYKFIK